HGGAPEPKGPAALADPPPSATPAAAPARTIAAVATALAASRRPVAILGLELDPQQDTAVVRAFVEGLNVPVLVTPKAKGLWPEDHPLFCGVCGGVAGDGIVLGLLERGGLAPGLGFRPVRADHVGRP